MGKDAGDSFEPTPNVMNAYDKRFIQPGVLEPKALDDILVVGTLGTPDTTTYRWHINPPQTTPAHQGCRVKIVKSRFAPGRIILILFPEEQNLQL